MTVTLNIKKYDELTPDEQAHAISKNKECVLSHLKLKESDIPKEDLTEFLHNFFNSGFFTFDKDLTIRNC